MLEKLSQSDRFSSMIAAASQVLEELNEVGEEAAFVDRIDDILDGENIMTMDDASVSAALFDLDLEELAALEAIEVQMSQDAVMEAERQAMENEMLQANLIASNSPMQAIADTMTEAEEIEAMFIAAGHAALDNT